MDDAKRHFTKLGAEGLLQIAGEYNLEDDFGTLEQFLDKKDRALDLGCGYGRTAIPLLRRGFDIYGLDITPLLIKEARRKALRLGIAKNRFIVGDMRALPYGDSSFDKVFSMWNSFNHILTEADQVNVLDQIYRVLKPSGVAFLVTLDGEQKLYRDSRNNPAKMKSGGDIVMYYIHDRKHLKRITEQSRFTEFKIGFKYMNGKRRIVVYLYKSI